MNCLFVLMAMSQTTITIDPAYKVSVSIQAPADVRVLANGVQITSNGVTIMVTKSGIIPAPFIPGLNPRATAFLASTQRLCLIQKSDRMGQRLLSLYWKVLWVKQEASTGIRNNC